VNGIVSDQFVRFAWSCAFLIPWALFYLLFPIHRQAMVRVSLFTMPFGLTEPLFVPEYWSPDSLFDLAQRTGFDIESLIFCFGIGGVGAVLYNVITGSQLVSVSEEYRALPRHRYHRLALAAPFIAFPLLYVFDWNPIYPSILAMLIGGLATIACRPDLKSSTWLGGVLFVGYYWIFLQGLEWLSPGYIDRTWNLQALWDITLAGMPIEELLFAFTFGLYWAGVYSHFTWRRPAVYQSNASG
jgi:hypothetical protein